MKRYETAGSVAGTAGRVRYDVGDFEIPVEWFQRDTISGGDERRTFKAWVTNEATNDVGPVAGQTYTFNSTELRLISTETSVPGGAVQLEMRAHCHPSAGWHSTPYSSLLYVHHRAWHRSYGPTIVMWCIVYRNSALTPPSSFGRSRRAVSVQF